ncbi:MAG: hypothetical protein QOG64_2013 [Acidimicrobiaceae bacterium]|nr:hypothetical protein [Acidimicrobiaceae bacterium]
MPIGLIALLAVLLPLVFEAVRTIAGGGRHVALWGDNPLLELAARDTLRGHNLLGPYSRFGWHHPGPAYFLWLALPVWLLGPSGPGLFLGATLLNLAASAAGVALVWRRVGVAAAAWSAACLALFFVCLTPDFLRQPWNPFVVVLPLVLLLLLCADAAAGHAGSWLWALVVGSFAIQTHVSTLPVVVVVIGAAGLIWIGRWRSGRSGRSGRAGRAGLTIRGGRWSRAAASALFVLLWLPPLIDAAKNRPSNLTLMWRFFTAPQPHHSLADAARASVATATILPFGADPFAVQQARSHLELVLGAVGLLVLGLVVVAVGVRRRQWEGAALGAGGLAALGVGILATTRVVDSPIYSYLVIWQSFVPVTMLIGLGIVVFGGRRGRWLRPAELGLLGLAVAMAGWATVRDAEAPASWQLANADVAATALAIEHQLGPGERTVRITIVSHDTWPTAAGIALELERAGRRTTVANTSGIWTVLFGSRRATTGREQADVELYLTSDGPAAAAAQGQPVATAGTTVVLLRHLSP